jgi:signal transduction histidine kinase
MLTATQIAGFVGAGLAGAAYIPQISHLIRARCSAGISRLAFAVWLLASLLITARAIAIHAGVFIVLGGIQIVATAVIMIYATRYKNTPCPIHRPRQPGAKTGPGIREHHVPMPVLRHAQRTHEPLAAADATGDDRFARDPCFADAGCCSLLAVPILSRGLLRAVLLLENRLLRRAFATERPDRLKPTAGQLAVSLDNAQLYAELTASRARIVAAGDQARRRIERDLHDGAQQRLVSLALQLRAAQAALPPGLGAQLDRAVAEATGALEELRETAHGLHPAILAEGGLRPALETLARRSPIPVDLRVHAGERLPEPVEVSAYYLVAEALTNAAKHARASAVTVTAEADTTDAVLRVTVRDDGGGGADPARGTGLAGLKDRVEALGGRVFVDSPPGAGTTLRAELPLTTANGALSSR